MHFTIFVDVAEWGGQDGQPLSQADRPKPDDGVEMVVNAEEYGFIFSERIKARITWAFLLANAYSLAYDTLVGVDVFPGG
jgi:hypothetical protein